MKFKLQEQDKLEIMKNRLYALANSEQKEAMNEIFSQEIEIPPTGVYDLDSDPDWYVIDDYMTPETKKKLGLE